MATKTTRLGRKPSVDTTDETEPAEQPRRSINKATTTGERRRLSVVEDEPAPGDGTEETEETEEQPETDEAETVSLSDVAEPEEAPPPKRRGRKPRDPNAVANVGVAAAQKNNSSKRADLAMLSDSVMEFASVHGMQPLQVLIATQTLLEATGDIDRDEA